LPGLIEMRVFIKLSEASGLTFLHIVKWRRLFGQKFVFVKWCLAKIGLSTATLAAPCIGQERAAGG